MINKEVRAVIPNPVLVALESWEAAGWNVAWDKFADSYSPITTRHVGTIAFQGTDAEINEAMKKWLGGVK